MSRRLIPQSGGAPGVVVRGPLSWSSDTTLALPSRVLCWDVNRWYRDLGLEWPYTHYSMGDIRRAFLALDGPNDSRLTHIFIHFLDRDVKVLYDAMPLDQRYPDRYVLEEERTRRLTAMGVKGDSVAAEDHAAADDPSLLDNGDPGDEDGPEPARITESEDDGYPFSIFLWDTEHCDPVVVAAWYRTLAAALRIVGVRSQISLGIMEGQGLDWMIGSHKSAMLIFLDRYLTPSRVVSQEIALKVLSHLDTRV